jgi:phospholipase C
MSFCGSIIREVTWLERKAQALVTQVCTVQALENCADWHDEGYNKCVATRDEGYNACARSRDEGYSQCCDWAPCSWFCDAFVWISNIVCVAWTWISNIVCVVWNWISKWVCRVVYWIYKTICKLIVSIIFWVIKHVLEWAIFLPCKFHQPSLDSRIKHIFVLVLENRSFDHMLGATPIRGNDADGHLMTETVRRPDDATNMVRDANGNVTQTCKVGTGQKRSVGVDPGHEFGDTLVMLCGSRASSYPPYPPIDNSGFAQNFSSASPNDPCSIMLSYRGDAAEGASADVPVISALAREFVVCDHWFSSMPGPTWPNRLFYHAASAAGLDDSPATGDTLIDALVSGIIFENGTIYDLLDSENIDWAVYHGDNLPQVLALSGMDVLTTSTHFHDMDEFEADLADGSIANYVFIEPDYGDDVTSSTFKCGNSQHPLDDITHGERLIKRVYEAIRNSPVWEESLLIVGYDEGGGFFDSVHPGSTVAPGDTITDPANNHHNFDFTQLGVRVPAIVCSPWIPRNLIDHRVYEHASVPSTVEALWGLPSMTDRDAHARNLTSLLSLSSPRADAPTRLPNAADPEAQCPDDPPPVGTVASGLTAARPQGATIVDPVTLARAAQQNPRAITSTAGAFFQLAVRRDLLLAPSGERRAILAQARRFQTMGEVGVYTQRVADVVDAHNRHDAQPLKATGRRRR